MQLDPIAYVQSPYKQKFAIPRQPNLVREAEGELLFTPAYADANALRGLEGFSHLWLIFGFHANAAAGWSATVAPPRLGGATHVGVFATRSPYRPNPLGLSVVEFAGIAQHGDRLVLRVRGLDLLNGTPIYDIKPYLPYADAVVDAKAAYAAQAPAACAVRFSEAARHTLTQLQQSQPRLEAFITAVLAQDPRPAQHVRHPNAERVHGMFLLDFNIRWRVHDGAAWVLSIESRTGTASDDHAHT